LVQNGADFHASQRGDSSMTGEAVVHFRLVRLRPPAANPLGVKRLGGIGIVAAAIANAIYRAPGKRVRDLPINLDKLQH
jgi:CO/xanthine dehydrogenase Mo-binding subunit